MDKLTLTNKKEGEKLTVIAVGRIDTTNAPDFESEIKSYLEGVTDLVIDFEKIEYISSSGLRALLSMHKLMTAKGGSFVVRKPGEMVAEVFEVTGFADILTIEN